MNALMVGSSALTIINTFRTDIITKTVSTASTGILGMLTNITANNNPNIEYIKLQLANLDLRNKIEIIKEFIEEQQSIDIEKNSVRKAIDAVANILDKIHSELYQLMIDMQNHRMKYFNGLRTFVCTFSMEALVSHSIILDNRFAMLVNIIKVYK